MYVEKSQHFENMHEKRFSSDTINVYAFMAHNYRRKPSE
jgi:hypothetical protein